METAPQQLDSGVLNDYHQLMDQDKRVGSDLSLKTLVDLVRYVSRLSMIEVSQCVYSYNT